MKNEATVQPSISVCMLTANRDHLLGPLLTELISQLSPIDEIIILDTIGSTKTKELIKALGCAQVRYETYAMNEFNFAAARNELLRLATCDIVAYIDDDAFPFPDWLEQIRGGLVDCLAAGGTTVADGALPDWWHPDVNWCIGLGPPGTVLGMPGYYPDTCNMAANAAFWKTHPFEVVSRQDNHLYTTGREDAEWWKDRRVAGDDVRVNFRQAVMHQVHSDRINLRYLKQRARNDGIASWLRRPSSEAATSIPWDLAHIAGVVFDKTVRRPFDLTGRLPDTIWLQRQWSKYLAVWKDNVGPRPRRRQQAYQLGKAAAFQVKIRAGEAVFRSANIIRHRGEFPCTSPRSIFISADCLLGDTILLRRHVQAVAQTFDAAEVLVSSRYPQLLSGLGTNVNVQPTHAAAELVRNGRSIDAAIVPYFHMGDYRLWREKLSPVGTTFDCDTGFPGRRDYIYARRLVQKNLELHEHENLARLFRLWPLVSTQVPPAPEIPDVDMAWAKQTLSRARISGKYIIVQFGAGYESKEWPLDRWIPFLRELGKQGMDLPIIITGGPNWQEAGEIAVREVKHPAGMISLFGHSIAQLLPLISNAAYFIGACSGLKHLAMAYTVPTFTLYAATEPHRWGASEDHQLHAYANALPQKLTGMELQSLDVHHRIRLLDPTTIAEQVTAHFKAITRQEPRPLSHELFSE